jgi:hypothetical protein
LPASTRSLKLLVWVISVIMPRRGRSGTTAASLWAERTGSANRKKSPLSPATRRIGPENKTKFKKEKRKLWKLKYSARFYLTDFLNSIAAELIHMFGVGSQLFSRSALFLRLVRLHSRGPSCSPGVLRLVVEAPSELDTFVPCLTSGEPKQRCKLEKDQQPSLCKSLHYIFIF